MVPGTSEIAPILEELGVVELRLGIIRTCPGRAFEVVAGLVDASGLFSPVSELAEQPGEGGVQLAGPPPGLRSAVHVSPRRYSPRL